jgi:hypothetical protein
MSQQKTHKEPLAAVAYALAYQSRRLREIAAAAQERATEKTQRADAAAQVERADKQARAEAALNPAIEAIEAAMPALIALCAAHRPVFEQLEKIDPAALTRMPARVTDRSSIVQTVSDAASLSRTAVLKRRPRSPARGRRSGQPARRRTRICAACSAGARWICSTPQPWPTVSGSTLPASSPRSIRSSEADDYDDGQHASRRRSCHALRAISRTLMDLRHRRPRSSASSVATLGFP